jgi:quercetin dioxygenase-like cupin family protein
MQFYRLYAGADGQSHFEALDSGKTSAFFNSTRAAKGVLFRNGFAPHIVNYHRAPHRRWVITLAGSVEIGVGDGTKVTFHPGDVFLAEDTTGQGHTATPRDWVRAYVDIE